MLKNDILYYLENYKGNIITGGDLAKHFNVSRTAIWKAIHSLQKDGNQIEALPNSGYKLLEKSDGLSEQKIKDGLITHTIGKTIRILKSVDSTNQYIKAQEVSALPEGYTVIANEQTDGRGRLGRRFYSPANEGIYLSVLLKPRMPLRHVPLLTLCAAVAVCRAVEMAADAAVQIKWVNDVFLAGKKLCGILTEGIVSAELGTMESVVIGIGINTGSIAEEVEDIAASLYQTEGGTGLRNRLIAEVLNQFEKAYFTFMNGDKQAILEDYTKRLFIIGRVVTVNAPTGSFQGQAVGISDWGELLVKQSDGEIRTVSTGEITLYDSASYSKSI